MNKVIVKNLTVRKCHWHPKESATREINWQGQIFFSCEKCFHKIKHSKQAIEKNIIIEEKKEVVSSLPLQNGKRNSAGVMLYRSSSEIFPRVSWKPINFEEKDLWQETDVDRKMTATDAAFYSIIFEQGDFQIVEEDFEISSPWGEKISGILIVDEWGEKWIINENFVPICKLVCRDGYFIGTKHF